MQTIAKGITQRVRGARIEGIGYDERTGYLVVSLTPARICCSPWTGVDTTLCASPDTLTTEVHHG